MDWGAVAEPGPQTSTTAGLWRRVVVGPAQGATHSELAVGGLARGGWLARHVHSFEEALYVLEGDLVLEIDRRVHRLGPGDYAFMPIGVAHSLAAYDSEVRWLAFNTPPRRPSEAPVADTIFAPRAPDVEAMRAAAQPLSVDDPLRRFVGHYLGTPPQHEALRLDDPARGRRPAGRDIALQVYSGISVKMLIDRTFGAELMTLFTVDYEIGGAAQAHDHPFEETYFFLAGEVQAELDGQAYTFRPGDVAFAAVGGVHGFWNDGPQRVRWIETQAPQPPFRHSYRWEPLWQRVAERGVEP